MGRRRPQRGRSVNGILLLDKPLGISSNDALQRVKRMYNAQKAGHTGSLDPLAGGLLPLCFGGATKLSTYLLDADKRYLVRVLLGVTTTTGDAEGEIRDKRSTDQVTERAVLDVLPRFTGRIQQLPPMYSALKHQGKRLYELARQGIEVERAPREIMIHELRLVQFALPEIELDVVCSKGTYVRTLAEDIGSVLGCGAHVVGLRRTGVGPYGENELVGMQQLENAAEQGFAAMDDLLLPLDSALEHWPAVRLSADAAFYLKKGQPVLVPKAPTEGWVRLYESEHKFIGIGEVEDDGRIAPRRLLIGG